MKHLAAGPTGVALAPAERLARELGSGRRLRYRDDGVTASVTRAGLVRRRDGMRDARRGQSLVVWVIWEGREAARGVDTHLMGETFLPTSPEV